MRVSTFLAWQELAASLQGPGRLHAMKCDVSKDAELVAMFADVVAKHGPIRVCVNNAGFGSNKNLMGMFGDIRIC